MLNNEAGSGYTSGDGAAVWHFMRNANQDPYYFDTYNVAGETLIPEGQGAEYSGWSNSFMGWDSNKHNFYLGNNTGWASNGGSYGGWIFRKYKQFMDFGEFTKTSSGAQTFSHNLDATPYFLMVKRLSSTTYTGYNEWMGWIGSEGSGKYLEMNAASAYQNASSGVWNDTNPTSTQFTLGSTWDTGNYKYWIWPQYGEHINVGYYNGNSSTKTVYTSVDGTFDTNWKPQAVAIRVMNGGGNWIWMDTKRGLSTSGSEQAKFMNSNSRDTADRIDLTATGFKAYASGGSDGNSSGGKYMYMAIREE